MGYVVLARVAVLLLDRVVRRPRPPAVLDRSAEHLRVQPADVGPLGGHHGLPARAGVHPLVSPAATRVAEMGRLYVGTLSLLCSVLLTVMVTILTPLSLPTDIQQQTIYTVVSKPVRRLELIWGRMIGYMALVTVLVAVFGGISLVYLWRTVGSTIDGDRAAGGQGAGKRAA